MMVGSPMNDSDPVVDDGPTSAAVPAAAHTDSPGDVALISDLDRLSLEQALRDFEIANARVLDLTGRLTTLNGELNDAIIDNQALAERVAELEAEVLRLRGIEQSRAYAVIRVVRGGRRLLGWSSGRDA